MTLKTTLSFLIFILIIFAGCKNEFIKADVETQSKMSFKITISSGGGFTALYKGYTMDETGQVICWQRLGLAEKTVQWTAQGSIEKIKRFKQQLETGGLFKQKFQETGNMTTIVSLDLPDSKYSWLWVGNGVSESTPDFFKQWYLEAEQFCKNLNK